MAVRTTIDIPEPLHDRLRHRAESTGVSIRSLVVKAIEHAYPDPKKGVYVTGPIINAKGKRRGPRFPTTKNPYDLFLP